MERKGDRSRFVLLADITSRSFFRLFVRLVGDFVEVVFYLIKFMVSYLFIFICQLHQMFPLSVLRDHCQVKGFA